MNTFKGYNKNNPYNSKHYNSNLHFFINAFKKRLGRTPNEYINEKLKNGSRFEDVEYLFNIVAAEISNQNNCKFFEFDYFYKNDIPNKPQPKTNNSHKSQRPANAGKYWTAEEEQLLIKMYQILQLRLIYHNLIAILIIILVLQHMAIMQQLQ